MVCIIISIVIILFALWNVAAINRSKIKPKIDWFHIWGFIIKLPLLYFLYPNILYLLIYFNIAWTLYDLIISKGISGKWFLIVTTSWFDKTLGKYKFYIQGLLLILTILYSIFM
jgi:hypothetical protein